MNFFRKSSSRHSDALFPLVSVAIEPSLMCCVVGWLSRHCRSAPRKLREQLLAFVRH